MYAFLITLIASIMAASGSVTEPLHYQILTTDKTSSTVREGDFTAIPYLIAGLYYPEIKNLEVNVDWKKPLLSAWALKTEKGYSINFWGGLARIPGMNPEGHALTACHELGHILGGTPRMKITDLLWSSAEGQSDFFATQHCLKRYFRHVNTYQKLQIPKTLPEVAFTLCRTTYSDELDFRICLHSMKGIEGFGHVLAFLSKDKERPRLEDRETSKVKETLFNSYPSKQCRIDTLVQGSLNGVRPSCWYFVNSDR